MKKHKACGMTSECWSGFTKVLGIGFIIVATILTLITMNGLGILGMFIVGAMLCRRKCPCCVPHDEYHGQCGPEDKPKPKPKAKPKKEVVKK
ncbi:MAG: hypothetical protein K0U24_07375 [Gammaproteobacteria bacterium]|nr:hypothetical protein [Gammaproteobacteria bacterium]MCH9764022.1 hypothetical protein [Gammaproteobacteria bacterium]